MKFTTEVFTGGGNTAGFWIPNEVVESFGKGKKFPVIVTINGYSYKNTVASYEGKYAIGVSVENREKANVKVGDKVEINIEYDDIPRTVVVPEDMQKVLDSNSKAKGVFNNLAYSHRKEYVRWIEDAKKEETKVARLEKLNKMILEKHSS